MNPLGKQPQPFVVFRIQDFACPECRTCGNRIEIRSVTDAATGFVVIATHENLSELLGNGNHLVRIGPISHDVTQIPNQVVRRRRVERRVQRIQIGMNVA